jgi:hypothetical protein
MNDSYPIASIAELIGDAARAEILVALLDGGLCQQENLRGLLGFRRSRPAGIFRSL